MKSNRRLFLRSVLMGVALLSAMAGMARANFLDDIGNFFSGNAPEVASSGACYSYATAAVNFSSTARTNNCPLSGPRYGTDYNSHYFWCMGVTPETSRAEGQARNDEVQACNRHLSFCNVYSDLAANGAYENKIYNCGFSGPRWGEGREGHRSYCLSVRIAQEKDGYTGWPQSEMDARLAEMKQCKAKNSEKKIQVCNSYAHRAVRSANTFKEKNCDPSQNSLGRWDSDYEDHFSWCIGQGSETKTIKAANAETGPREAVVAACEARGGGPVGLTPVVNKNSGAFGVQGKIVAPANGAKSLAPTIAPRRPAMPRVQSLGSGGPSLSHSPTNSAMERLNPTGMPGNQGYTAPTTRAGPKMPCNTCGSNTAKSSNETIRPSPAVQPQPTLPRPTMPRPTTVPDTNFNYGNCGGCGENKVRLPK